jgi:hypothetical protein
MADVVARLSATGKEGAMAEDKLKRVLADVGGKKAKEKVIETAPEGTRGKPLDKDVKAALEEQFGSNLSKVRVHTGGNAPDIARDLGAKAFTIGNDIYFAKPGDAKNPEVLAHELAHVLQSKGGRMPPGKDGKALTSK